MEKFVLVPFEKYQRLLQHSKPDHQERMKQMQPPPGKRDTSQKKGQTVNDNIPLVKKKETGKLKENTSIHWISF